jgi:ABC-type transport system involved in multi-copper enzyme maturation permease subunit
MSIPILDSLAGAPTWAIFRRELASYFATPVAYVFIVIFLLLSGAFTFYSAASTNAARPTCSRSSASTRGSTCS